MHVYNNNRGLVSLSSQHEGFPSRTHLVLCDLHQSLPCCDIDPIPRLTPMITTLLPRNSPSYLNDAERQKTNKAFLLIQLVRYRQLHKNSQHCVSVGRTMSNAYAVLYVYPQCQYHSLSIVSDKFDLDIGSSSGKLSDTDTSPSGFGVGHQFLVDLDISSFLTVISIGRSCKGSCEGSKRQKEKKETYLVDCVEILAKIREIDVCLDDILQSHISSFENSFQVLNNLSSSILDLETSVNPSTFILKGRLDVRYPLPFDLLWSYRLIRRCRHSFQLGLLENTIWF
jgi:hypothetical protein